MDSSRPSVRNCLIGDLKAASFALGVTNAGKDLLGSSSIFTVTNGIVDAARDKLKLDAFNNINIY